MNIEIANRLVNLRKNTGLSQEALAEKLGISRQAVSKWERAEASPDTDNLILLAKIYKISLDELLASDELPIIEKETPAPQAPPEKDDFKKVNGLHFKSSDGEFYIGQNGIYAKDYTDQEELHIKDTAHIIVNGQQYTFKEAREKWGHNHCHAAKCPIAILVTLLYVAIGVFYDVWHPTWLLFLLIPVSSGILSARQSKNWIFFPYSILITTIYLTLGFFYNVWHPAWVLFLTIPLYHSLINYFYRDRKLPNE